MRDQGMSTWGAWAVFAAFAVHNAEEALFAPAHFDRMQSDLPLAWPSVGVFQIATMVVTVIGLALTVYAVRRQRPDWVSTLAAIMLVNVFVPHVPLAVLGGGYTPGLVTALALNLPVDAWWLWQRRRVKASTRT